MLAKATTALALNSAYSKDTWVFANIQTLIYC